MAEIDYKESYEELKDWIIKLHPYCYNCKAKDSGDDSFCDDCYRKMFNWECDPKFLLKLIIKG